MGYTLLHLVNVNTLLVGFTGDAMVPEGVMRMRVKFETPPCITSFMVVFFIVNVPSAYNVILDRKFLYEFGATISININVVRVRTQTIYHIKWVI
jgi:hypothetical protein